MWKPTMNSVNLILPRIPALSWVSVKFSFVMVRIVWFIPRGCLICASDTIRLLRGPERPVQQSEESSEESS